MQQKQDFWNDFIQITCKELNNSAHIKRIKIRRPASCRIGI